MVTSIGVWCNGHFGLLYHKDDEALRAEDQGSLQSNTPWRVKHVGAPETTEGVTPNKFAADCGMGGSRNWKLSFG